MKSTHKFHKLCIFQEYFEDISHKWILHFYTKINSAFNSIFHELLTVPSYVIENLLEPLKIYDFTGCLVLFTPLLSLNFTHLSDTYYSLISLQFMSIMRKIVYHAMLKDNNAAYNNLPCTKYMEKKKKKAKYSTSIKISV